MVEQNPQVIPENRSKKRAFCTQELIGKFRSKQDFVDYFSNQRKKPLSLLISLCSPALLSGWYNGHERFLKASFRREEKTLGNEWSLTSQRSFLRWTFGHLTVAWTEPRPGVHDVHARFFPERKELR